LQLILVVYRRRDAEPGENATHNPHPQSDTAQAWKIIAPTAATQAMTTPVHTVPVPVRSDTFVNMATPAPMAASATSPKPINAPVC